MKDKVLDFLVFGGLIGLLLMAAPSCDISNKSTYDISEPISGIHPIVMIVNGKSQCTAFVISDSIALTAGHCIRVADKSKKQSINRLKKMKNKIQRKLSDIESCNTLSCNLTRLNLSIQLEALKADIEYLQDTKADEFTVHTIGGKKVGKAIAEMKHHSRDFGYIKGNFKKFKKLKIDKKVEFGLGDTLRACGYAGGDVIPVCIDFEAIGQLNFSYVGKSMLVPGMSGGPVIDSNGRVVGINAAVQGGVSIMTPLIGVKIEGHDGD